MTELIDSVQIIEPGSELVYLFELELDSSTTLYFHPGVEADLSTVQFRDKSSPYTVRTYTALPIEMSSLEINADGAMNRPELTIANVLNTFSASIGTIRNEDLVGKALTQRSTLKKYLYGETGDASPPIEFPSRKFYLDRIINENNVAVTFELASPFDLSGIKIPNRTVIGKYCSWIYQGHSLGLAGGCTWSKNSTIDYADGSGSVNSHKAYFSIDNKPIVPTGTTMTGWGTAGTDYFEYGTYSAATTYSAGQYVEYTSGGQTTIWVCTLTTTGNDPESGSAYWKRGDICGKTLESCKCRFQFTPASLGSANQAPSTTKNTSKSLPFGAFIGSMKFR